MYLLIPQFPLDTIPVRDFARTQCCRTQETGMLTNWYVDSETSRPTAGLSCCGVTVKGAW